MVVDVRFNTLSSVRLLMNDKLVTINTTSKVASIIAVPAIVFVRNDKRISVPSSKAWTETKFQAREHRPNHCLVLQRTPKNLYRAVNVRSPHCRSKL